jgi:ankyrin repeat protein
MLSGMYSMFTNAWDLYCDPNVTLHEAVRTNNGLLARAAIARGGDIDSVQFLENGVGGTALHYAAYEGKTHMVRLLIQIEALVDASSFRRSAENHDRTPITYSSLSPNYESLSETPLHWAARMNQIDAAAILIAEGKAYVNAFNNNMDTPLHFAARNGNRAMASLLLRQGARVNSVNEEGLTPAMVAKRYQQDHMVKLLTPSRLLPEATEERSSKRKKLERP